MKCSICRNVIAAYEEIRVCEKCTNSFHAECWDENGGCGTPGCPNLPRATRKQDANAVEDSYWGVTNKVCPACRETIKVSELVCPFCHESFDTTAPLTAADVKERYIRRPPPEVPEKKVAIIIFICGLLGCLAPFNLIFGGIWYVQKRKILREASPLHNLLVIIGLSISGAFLLLALIGILFHH